MEPLEYWVIFAVIGLINGLIKNEKVIYLKWLLFSAVVFWTFIYVPFIKGYNLSVLKILYKISLPQFLFYLIPFRITNYILYESSKSKIPEKDFLINMFNELKIEYELKKGDDFIIIKNQFHKNELKKALENCNKSIVITSGWVSDYVINEEFLKLIHDALLRGVKFRIVYGYKQSNGIHTSSKNAIKKLNELNKIHNESFKIIEHPMHSKILIVDNKYAVCGSFNWLSNGKDIPNNTETSIKSYDKVLINKLNNLIRTTISEG